MDTVPNTLEKYLNAKTLFRKAYGRLLEKDSLSLLIRFLHASVDEVRLKLADEYSRRALCCEGCEEMAYFRTAVLKREVTADIEWAKHRDHAAHTLNNYILGWYIYDNVKYLRDIMRNHIRQREINDTKKGDTYVDQCFRAMWPYVSILHDIGYLFEGTLLPLSTESQNSGVRKGATIVEDFFRHQFWLSANMDSHSYREIARKLSGVSIPDFHCETMADLADKLCYVGDCEKIRDQAFREMKYYHSRVPKVFKKEQGIPVDAFDLWIKHYEHYGKKGMANRIRKVQKAYKEMMMQGVRKSGTRMLDHGVCSGLLSLQNATYFYRILFSIDENKVEYDMDREVWRYITSMRVSKKGIFEIKWWWGAILWATAATAIHDLQQSTGAWPELYGKNAKLRLREDPLAYLGILVDILQEWDRYSVIPNSLFSGELPLQGSDTKLGYAAPVVVINYRSEEKAKRVIDNLENALVGWQKIVRVEPTVKKRSRKKN